MSRGTSLAAGLFIFIGGALALAQTGTPKEKRATPPAKWDARVTEAFFSDARTALSGERPKFTSGTPGGNTADNTGANMPNDPGGSSTGQSYAWSKLISSDTLQSEVKNIQPQLAEDVKTPQTFAGGGFKKARKNFTVLALAFAIIGEYDGDVKWKNQSAAARELFARAGNNCKTNTVQAFNEGKLRSEDLQSILGGETVTPPENIEPKIDWGKVAARAPLMSRLDVAQMECIGPWTGSPEEFKKNGPALKHEAELVAAIAEVLIREGSEDWEDDTYKACAKDMQKGALQVIDAVNNKNAESARLGAGIIGKACAACHSDYRS